MKILQVNSVCGTGSTGKIAAEISDCLNANNIENYIAYGYGTSDRPNAYKIGNMLDSHLHSFISRKLCMQGYGSHFPTWKLIRYIRKIKPDIVHLHNIHGHYLNFKILFKFLNSSDIKVVWTFHDSWPYTGRCACFGECHQWRTACLKCPILSNYPDSERDRCDKNYTIKKKYFTANENMHIVTVSEWLKENVEKSYLKDKHITRIYNGIDTSIYHYIPSELRKKYNLENKFIILGIASIWNERKGLDYFVQLADMISEDLHIVMIGKNSSEAAKYKTNITAIPNINDKQELVKWYSTADVFINTSSQETFGLVVGEAMACGTPAIVFNSTACPEVPGIGSEFVVEKNNIQAIVDEIIKIKSNGKDYYSDALVSRINDNFSLNKMTGGYLNLYKDLEWGYIDD